MKENVNFCDFTDRFNAIRPDNFSYDGLKALYEWLEQYEDDTGEEIELDVIALCCDYSEMSFDEVVNDYISFDKSLRDELNEQDEDEQNEWLAGWLNDRTIVIPVDSETVIIQAF